MSDTVDEINKNLSPDISERIRKTEFRRSDGTTFIGFNEIEKITRSEGGTKIESNSQILIDDLGNPILSPENFGGECTCGNLVHKDYFYHCQRCSRPLCSKCVSFKEDEPYCAWCKMIDKIKSVFKRRKHHEKQRNIN